MLRLRSRRLLVMLACAMALVLITGTVVVAATVLKTARAVTAVSTSTANDAWGTYSTTPVNLPGGYVALSVPSGEQALLLVTFSAQETCYGTPTYPRCHVRVIVDGNVAQPGAVIFDAGSDASSSSSEETNSMQFVAGPVGSGNHTVLVQVWSEPFQTFFVFGPRMLTVLRARV